MRLKKKLAPGAVGSCESAAPLYSFMCHGMRLYNLTNVRWHWAKKKKYTDAVRSGVTLAFSFEVGISLDQIALECARVRITIAHKGVFDHDGMYSAAKPVLDAIVARPIKYGLITLRIRRWGLIVDDSPKHIDLEVRQEKGEYGVFIEVWEVKKRS